MHAVCWPWIGCAVFARQRWLPLRLPLRLLAAAALWACAALAAAQTPALRFLQNKDGLTNMAVTALAHDRDHRLWIGTENGLYRYAGERVEPIDAVAEPLQDTIVAALAADARGRLWIGMRQQLFVLDPGQTRATRVGESVPVDTGATLATAPDGVWVLSGRRLLRVTQRPGAPVQVRVALDEHRAGPLRSLLAAGDNELWLGCGRTLCHWNGRELERLGPAQGVPPGCWGSTLLASDGALWALSGNRILRRLAGTERFVDATPPGSPPVVDNVVGDCRTPPIAEDREGRVLVFSNEGLRRWSGGQWQLMRSPAWSGADAMSMNIDRDGDLWLGTTGWGVAQWRGYRHWRNWTTELGSAWGDTWGFSAGDPGSLWMASNRGALHFDARAGRLLPAPPDGQAVSSFERDGQGRLWSGTFEGTLRRLDGRHGWRPVAHGLPEIRALMLDSPGQLMIGTQGGVYSIDPRDASARPTRWEGLADERRSGNGVYRLCRSAGRLWVSAHQGLFWTAPGQRLVPADVDGLPKGRATSLACGTDEVWVVMEPGQLWHVAGSGGGRWTAERLTPDVLTRRGIVSLMQDSRGWLWVGTDSGLILRTPAGWRRFDESAGLVWPDANLSALHEDVAGAIWVGTSRGVSQIVHPEALVVPATLEVVVDSVKTGARSWPAQAAKITAASRDPVLVDWHVLSPLNRDSLRTSYRLLGSDDGEDVPWTEAGRGAIRFDGLAPGAHRLQIMAANPDLDTQSPIVALEIEVQPPWWRSTMAIVAGCAALALLSYGSYRWRVRALLRNERTLQRLVGERTRELETSREQLREQALRDPLTGVWNRRALMEILAREVSRASRERVPLTVALADIDHFKRVNDTHGHPAGDAVLKEFARRLDASVRPYDAVGRYGGEEFLLVLPGLDLRIAADRARLEALHAGVTAPPMAVVGQLTCSIGAAAFDRDALADAEALIAAADAALYQAKAAGRDRVALAPLAGEAVPSGGERGLA